MAASSLPSCEGWSEGLMEMGPEAQAEEGSKGVSRGNLHLPSNEKPPELVAPQVTLPYPVPTQFPGMAKLPWSGIFIVLTWPYPPHTETLTSLSPDPTVTSTSSARTICFPGGWFLDLRLHWSTKRVAQSRGR